jgi:hypothetical protein
MVITRFFKKITSLKVIYELENEHNSLEELAIFLYFEVGRGSSRWIRLLNTLKEDGDETSGNLMTIEKRGNDVYIGNVYYEGPEDEQDYFVISKSQLTKLMIEWEQLMKEKPDVIILSEQSGKFELVGENYPKNMLYEKMYKPKK